MRTAVISDIHSNIEALQAVLARCHESKVDRIACLGDYIGYGANPKEVLDIAMKKFDIHVLGNHDEAVLKEPLNFNKIPRLAIEWTKKQFEGEANKHYLDFLWELSPIQRDGELIFSHGMLESNMNYVEEPEDVLFIFERMSLVEKVCFAGHSHLPGIWVLEDETLFYVDAEDDAPYILNEGFDKCWVNVGSVGQPRDRNPKSSFVIYDDSDKSIHFQRVKYDIKSASEKIESESGLDNFLAKRLHQGI